MCELSWMPTTESILSSRLRSVPPCRLRPPVLSDHICLAHWVVVICRFYCIGIGLDKALALIVNKPLSKPAMTSFQRCMYMLLVLMEFSPCNIKKKIQDVWITKNPHWTYVHIYELQFKTKCHSCINLIKKNWSGYKSWIVIQSCQILLSKRGNCAVI